MLLMNAKSMQLTSWCKWLSHDTGFSRPVSENAADASRSTTTTMIATRSANAGETWRKFGADSPLTRDCGSKSLIKILDDIVDMLDADAEPNCFGTHSGLL